MSAATLIVGGYTDRADLPKDVPRGLALHELRGGRARLVSALPLANPTWFEWDASRRVLYVSHSGMTILTAVAIPDGPESARVLDEIDIEARNPAHLAIAPTGDAVIAACFTAGEVVTVSLSRDGAFEGVRGRTVLDADGRGAEPHQISFGGDGFAVPDRARDEVHRFSWRRGLVPDLLASDHVASGRGPRHLARFGAAIAYLAGEFDSTVTILRTDGDHLVTECAMSTVPPEAAPSNSVAAIFLDPEAQRLFVSNRGHDSLAVFDISDPSAPRSAGWIPAGGRTPRFADLIAPGLLAIAALDSHVVTLLAGPDPARPEREIRVVHAAPACIRLLDLRRSA